MAKHTAKITLIAAMVAVPLATVVTLTPADAAVPGVTKVLIVMEENHSMTQMQTGMPYHVQPRSDLRVRNPLGRDPTLATELHRPLVGTDVRHHRRQTSREPRPARHVDLRAGCGRREDGQVLPGGRDVKLQDGQHWGKPGQAQSMGVHPGRADCLLGRRRRHRHPDLGRERSGPFVGKTEHG